MTRKDWCLIVALLVLLLINHAFPTSLGHIAVGTLMLYIVVHKVAQRKGARSARS
jgi:hypothetical protein